MTIEFLKAPTTWKQAKDATNANMTALLSYVDTQVSTISGIDPALVTRLEDAADTLDGAASVSDAAVALAVGDEDSTTRAALNTVVVDAATTVPPPTGDAATDTARIQAAIDAALAGGGGIVRLHAGHYYTNQPLTVGNNLIIQGAGPGRTRIYNGSSDIFHWAASRAEIRDLNLIATLGGGHIFLQTGNVLNCTFANMQIDQMNPDKSVYSHIEDQGNYLFNKWSHVRPYMASNSTVPAFHFKVLTAAGAANANTWEDMDPTRCGEYFFHFESARPGNYVHDNILRDVRFEATHGGCVRLLGTNRTTLDNVTVYDHTDTQADLIYVGKGTHASSPAPNRNLLIRGLLIATQIQNGHKHIVFQERSGATVENSELHNCSSHSGALIVDFGNAVTFNITGSDITRVNGNRGNELHTDGLRLGTARVISGPDGGAEGVSVDAAGNASASALDVGAGPQVLLNSEFTDGIANWSGGSILSAVSPGRARVNNTTGGFVNISATGAGTWLQPGALYKVVFKLDSVANFPANAVRFFVGGSSYTNITDNTSTEQVFYSLLGGTSVFTLRVADGTDVTFDYIRVYPIVAKPLTVHGALQHTGASAGFFGATPVAKPTGVAADAASIHAALVSLGLIAG